MLSRKTRDGCTCVGKESKKNTSKNPPKSTCTNKKYVSNRKRVSHSLSKNLTRLTDQKEKRNPIDSNSSNDNQPVQLQDTTKSEFVDENGVFSIECHDLKLHPNQNFISNLSSTSPVDVEYIK